MPRSKKPRKPTKPIKVDFDWEAMINGVRIGSHQIFESIIDKGEVNEKELEKLQNFVQFSLALMQLCGPQKWAQAKMNAELMGYLKEKKDD